MMLTIFSIASDKTHQLYILWFPFKKAGIIQHIMNTFYFGLNRGSYLILLLFYFITKREDVKLPERLTVWVKTNPTGIAWSSYEQCGGNYLLNCFLLRFHLSISLGNRLDLLKLPWNNILKWVPENLQKQKKEPKG